MDFKSKKLNLNIKTNPIKWIKGGLNMIGYELVLYKLDFWNTLLTIHKLSRASS